MFKKFKNAVLIIFFITIIAFSTYSCANASGWYEENENKYYKNEDGSLAYGKQVIDGETYYFNTTTGAMVKGEFITVDGKIYYFGKTSGTLQKTGWYKGTYYLDKTTGEVATGLKEIMDQQYYFNESGVVQKGKMITIGSEQYYFHAKSAYMIKGEFVTIDGKMYYFGAVSGALQKSGWYNKDGNKYYLDQKTGVVATGLKSISGNKYYFNSKGIMQKKKMITVGNDTYYFNKNGEMVKGHFITIDGKIYYFGATSGTLQKTGWYTKDGDKYYLDTTTGEVYTGSKVINGTGYLFADDGKFIKETIVTGLIEKDGKMYYYDENGQVVKGKMIAVDNDTYYFNESTGEMVKGQFITVDGKMYYFGKNSGTLQKGWYEKNGAQYYLNPTSGEVSIGLTIIDENEYYFNSKGIMQKGKYVIIDNDMYYFCSDGKMAKGKFITIDGKIYYFGKASGTLQKTGWYKKDGNKYYLDKETGEVYTGNRNIDGKLYSFDKNGKLLGEVKRIGLVVEDGLTYYYDENGKMIKGKMVTVSGKSYYFNSTTGAMVKGAFLPINGHYYYFGKKSGELQKTGWYTNINSKYYLDKNTGEVYTGEKIIDGETYYFDSYGRLMENLYKPGIIERDGKQYYQNENGEIVKGQFIEVEGTLYYFGASSGTMQKTGWYAKDGKVYYIDKVTGEVYSSLHRIGDKDYYFNSKGVLEGYKVTDENNWNNITLTINKKKYTVGACNIGRFQEINGKLYYYSSNSNSLMKIGWFSIFNELCYSDPVTGELYTGVREIDGDKYYFSKNGFLQSGYKEIDGNIYLFDVGPHHKMAKGIYGGRYYDANTGIMQKIGWYEYKGEKYYFDKVTGMIHTGYSDIEGKTYLFDSDGRLIALSGNEENLVTEDTGIYYVNNIGEVIKGEFIEINRKLYYFGAKSGTLQKTGWYNKNENTYYLNKTTGEVTTGFKTIGGKKYAFNHANGKLHKGFYGINDNYYYYDFTTGELRFGWIEISNQNEYYNGFYYSDSNGVLQKGIQTINDKNYYFEENYKLVKGWYNELIGSEYEGLHYGDINTGEAYFGLNEIGNYLYYFNEKGVALLNAEFEIDGKQYVSDENGHVTLVNQEENNVEQYYYSKLNEPGTLIYDEILNHLDEFLNGDNRIESTVLSNYANSVQSHQPLFDAYQNAVDAFNYDMIDLFYIDTTKIYIYVSYRVVNGINEYNVSFGLPEGTSSYLKSTFDSKEEVLIANTIVQNKEDDIIAEIVASGAESIYDKVLKVHDWLVENLEYDYTFSENCHNIYGTLVEEKPVCEGYAKAFKSILDKLRIECIVVVGTGNGEPHAWNYVQLEDENWYAVDVTLDDQTIISTGSGEEYEEWLKTIRYTYFLKGANDTEFTSTHVIDANMEVTFGYPDLAQTSYEMAA